MSMRFKKEFKKTNGRYFRMNIEAYNSATECVFDMKRRELKKSDGFNEIHPSEYFEGVNSYSEALNLLNNGYAPVIDEITKDIKFNKKGESKRISFENSVSGFAPIVPLAMMGVPNNMINMTMKPIKAKVIDVYYNISFSAYVTPDEIKNTGKNLLVSIMDLEKQGYKFNLYAMSTFASEKDADILVIKIKSSNTPIDLKRMSFPLTHPAFFRCIAFDWYGRNPDSKYRTGYGRPIATSLGGNKLDMKSLEKSFGDNAVLIHGSKILNIGNEHIKEVLVNDKNED